MPKIQRRYKLTFQIETTAGEEKAIEIRSPLTLELDVVRNTQSSLNSATFRVYNLSETNRSLIFQNRTSINDVSGNRKKVILQAGYETARNRDDDLATIFTGNLLEAYSYRQGSNVITYINAQDGALSAYNSTISATLEKGTSLKDVAKTIMSGLAGIKQGAIGEIAGEAKTAVAINGNNFNLLKKDYKDRVFIDLEKVNILNVNEYIKSTGGRVLLISSETGLLGTPQRQGTNLVMDVIFEPQIVVGQLVNVRSQVNPLFDGQYKVMGLKHSGIISGAVAGDCKTSLSLFIGDKLLGELKGI